MTQQIIHDDAHCRFLTHVDGHLCVLTYVLQKKTAVFAHTGVPDAVSGRGIAAALTQFALETARSKAWTVIPSCSYVEVYIKRHPEYEHLTYHHS